MNRKTISLVLTTALALTLTSCQLFENNPQSSEEQTEAKPSAEQKNAPASQIAEAYPDQSDVSFNDPLTAVNWLLKPYQGNSSLINSGVTVEEYKETWLVVSKYSDGENVQCFGVDSSTLAPAYMPCNLEDSSVWKKIREDEAKALDDYRAQLDSVNNQINADPGNASSILKNTFDPSTIHTQPDRSDGSKQYVLGHTVLIYPQISFPIYSPVAEIKTYSPSSYSFIVKYHLVTIRGGVSTITEIPKNEITNYVLHSIPPF